MRSDIFRPPTDEEIAEAEVKLAFAFPPAYRSFLKSGGDVAKEGLNKSTDHALMR